ncbi:MAG: bisanhydrobacterioruberin hydratase [Patescibacteria group bacterium]|jgi:putative membrane protein|nr:bisanhydrobacterioruberin hydratase [Patescibacteria group bacterium]
MLYKRNYRGLYLISILCFLVTAAFFTTAFPLEEKYQHISTIFVIFFAIPCYYGLVKTFGRAKAAIVILLMSLFALVLENIAIHTGFPYGRFSYGNLIGQTLGKVPWTVGFAWTPILFGAYALAQKVASHKPLWQHILLTALVMTAFDLVLDPGSVRLGFWTWENTVGFYNVPWSNFIGWLFSSSLAAGLLHSLLQLLKVSSTSFSSWSYSSFFLMLFYWIAVCLFSQLWWVALVGLVLFMVFWRSVRPT